MGLAGYYKRFVEGLLHISNSITSLQNKGPLFEWTPYCARSFQQLKNLLTSAPILRIVHPNVDFVVCMDACKEALSGVLSHNGNVVCYESRNLKEKERLYATHDLDLATIVHALNMWQHYLMGKRFELRKDHCGLKYLFGQQSFNSRQIRWFDFLSEYDFDIRHIRGQENKVVDALSKRVHEMYATIVSMYQIDLRGKLL
jgi:hypothetical protein